MAPYRQGPQSHAAPPAQEGGVVHDVIDQFADRFAFLRELVQNAIDAETELIEVELEYRRGDQLLVASVTDHGVGMSKETMEDELLVLFRSSKEDDESKIGKFGIGFASVLSVSPRVVRVKSSHEGQRHILHLYPDLSYELFLSGRSLSTGTTVELEIDMEPDLVDGFVLNAWQALTKWCRHACTEIRLRASDSHGHATLDERIDAPLGFDDSLVEVRHRSKDGSHVVLALRPTSGSYLAFFNSGLLLHESDESPLVELACKIQDPRLGHTLSRDNVRRDERYRRVLALARSLAADELPARVGKALEQLVRSQKLAAYDTLLARCNRADIGVKSRKGWPVPLLHPIEGQELVAARDLGHYYALDRSPLSEELSRRGIPIANLCDDVGMGELMRRTLIEQLCGESLQDVHHTFTLVQPLSAHRNLCSAIFEHLDDCYRAPREVFIADIHGAGASRRFLSGSPDRAWLSPESEGGAWILDEFDRPALARFRRRGLILNAGHPWVRAGLELSGRSTDMAARALVRLILIEHDALSTRRSLELLEAR